MKTAKPVPQRGLTLVELLVVVAIGALLVTLIAPSMRDLIALQRLKSINAELVTDLQYARSTAVARNSAVFIGFKSSPAMTCYSIYIPGLTGPCDCRRAPGNACGPLTEEIRTTQIPLSTDVQVLTSPNPRPDLGLSADGRPVISANFVVETTRISSSQGQMRVTINSMGRPTICSPDLSISGVAGC